MQLANKKPKISPCISLLVIITRPHSWGRQNVSLHISINLSFHAEKSIKCTIVQSVVKLWGNIFLLCLWLFQDIKVQKKGRGSWKHDCWSRIKKDCGILPLFTGGNEEMAFKWLCEIVKHWKWYVFEVRRSQELSRILLPYRWTCVQFIDAKVTFPVLDLAIVKGLDWEDSPRLENCRIILKN